MKQPKYHKRKVAFYKRKEFFSILVGIFLVMLMALGSVSLGVDEESMEFNGLSFVQTDYGWQAYTSDETKVLITTSPDYLEEGIITVDFSVFNSYNKVYYSVNPYDSTLSSALRDFQQNYKVLVATNTACFEDVEGCEDLPIKTCEDADETTGIIIFKEDDETVVSFENDCLTIQGKNLLTLTDTLIVNYYGEG